MKYLIILFILVVICGFIGKLEATSLLINGSFELGAKPSDTNNPFFRVLSEGSTGITNWTVITGPIDYVNDTYWEASDGSRNIDLSGPRMGGVMQAFTTDIGAEYVVKFDMAGNPASWGTPAIKIIEVSAADQSAQFTFDTTGKVFPDMGLDTEPFTDMGWVAKTFKFIATAPETTLRFTSLIDTPWGPTLDNVSVTPIPEPSTYLLFLFGLISMVGIKKKFT